MNNIIIYFSFGLLGGFLFAYNIWFNELEKEFFINIIQNGLPPLDFLIQTDIFKKILISFFTIGTSAIVIKELLKYKKV